jgi:hypothetical protein
MINSQEFFRLKSVLENFDWLPIKEVLGKTRFSRRGRKDNF